jgi:predicted Zn-ribbon and HTH transcriptional regulator
MDKEEREKIVKAIIENLKTLSLREAMKVLQETQDKILDEAKL